MEYLINKVRYYVDEFGEGFPLLLLHGFTGDGSTWSPFYKEWGKHSKMIIPDIIGHGKTESPGDLQHYNIESAANDLKGILDKMEINKVDLLGYSMGGRLALTFAFLFPNRVRKIILESASPGLSTAEEREQRRIKDMELANLIRDKGIVSFVDYWEKIPLFSTMNDVSVTIRESIRMQRMSQSPVGLANSLIGMGTGSQPSWWERLNQLTMEVLFVTGRRDEKFCQIADKMYKKFRNSRWITVENCGHAIHVEEKEKFGTIVSEFLVNT